jgi:Na+/H+ antiporter NhaD/arsenite permease-like protein
VGILKTIIPSSGFGSRLPFVDSSIFPAQEIELVAVIIATLIFLFVFIAISTHLLHETAAALLGAVIIFLVSYIGGEFYPHLRIMTFEEAMRFVDWNVIFLILGMMIFMAILAQTNVFRWLAFRLFQLTQGKVWLLVIALVILTGVTSAFLNDVTAILLIVPLSIQIAIAIGLNPFVVVIPEIMASNIGGAATLIGDPPSTIVGSHISLSFGEYFLHLAPIAFISMITLIIIIAVLYRKDLFQEQEHVSATLVERMQSEAEIKDRATLRKAIIVGVFTFVMFFLADQFGNMPPSVVALAGAVVLIIWVRPEMDSMLREVDWTTLIFFIGLFVVVGALDRSGALQWLAAQIQRFAGESLTTAVLLTEWVTGIASGIVANIPFTVAALPIADTLTSSFPIAAENNVIYFALILGADFGGNATYIGSAPNIVAVGLLALAGYRLTFRRYLRDGAIVTFFTLLVASIWLLIRY